MKIVLIILNTLVYLSMFFLMWKGPYEIITSLGMLFIVVPLNILSARYLYHKASTNKVEWALFGLLGNINSVFYYWLWDKATSRWKKGEKFFS